MTTYKEISIASSLFSKEGIEYLVDSTLTLMAKKKIILEAESELQMVMNCLREAKAAYAHSQEQADSTAMERLSDLDRQRDLDFSDLRLYLRSQFRHRQANRQEAAKVLFGITEEFKEMLTKPQAEQSAAMKAFFKKMEEKENRSRLSLVLAMDFYNNLKSSQEKFDTAYLKRVEGRSQRQSVSKDDARKHLLKTYRMVYRYLLCLEFFGKTTAHKELLGIFNDVRLSFRETQARKAGQAKKKSKQVEPIALLEEPTVEWD